MVETAGFPSRAFDHFPSPSPRSAHPYSTVACTRHLRPAYSRASASEPPRSFLDLSDSPTSFDEHTPSPSTPKRTFLGHGYSRSFQGVRSPAMDPSQSSFVPLTRSITAEDVSVKRTAPAAQMMVQSATRSTFLRHPASPAGPRPNVLASSRPLPAPPKLAPAPRGKRPTMPPPPAGPPPEPPVSVRSDAGLLPLPSAPPSASRPHPAQVGARRLSINTIKKMSSRPLLSPAFHAGSPSQLQQHQRSNPSSALSPSSNPIIQISTPSGSISACSSDTPELTADDSAASSTDWEDDDSIASPCSPSDSGSAIIQMATKQTLQLSVQPPATTRLVTPRKKRYVSPPPLQLVVPPRGQFIVCNATSPLSPSTPDSLDTPAPPPSPVHRSSRHPGVRLSVGSAKRRSMTSRRATRGSRMSMNSVHTTASGMPTFSAAAAGAALDPFDEDPPASPTLLHPLYNRFAEKRAMPASAIQEIRHVQEEDPFGDPMLTPKKAQSGKARQRLGLDAQDNVVEVFEQPETAKWRPARSQLAPRQVYANTPLPPLPPVAAKKSPFSRLKLFARRA